ncbi:hypothetical protein C8R45DRAFT_923948 [Mycena sanguinolenta]|nr:hypothetical protein C8R45DRAFT_923948 [Mycena sanguinolenta]
MFTQHRVWKRFHWLNIHIIVQASSECPFVSSSCTDQIPLLRPLCKGAGNEYFANQAKSQEEFRGSKTRFGWCRGMRFHLQMREMDTAKNKYEFKGGRNFRSQGCVVSSEYPNATKIRCRNLKEARDQWRVACAEWHSSLNVDSLASRTFIVRNCMLCPTRRRRLVFCLQVPWGYIFSVPSVLMNPRPSITTYLEATEGRVDRATEMAAWVAAGVQGRVPP